MDPLGQHPVAASSAAIGGTRIQDDGDLVEKATENVLKLLKVGVKFDQESDYSGRYVEALMDVLPGMIKIEHTHLVRERDESMMQSSSERNNDPDDIDVTAQFDAISSSSNLSLEDGEIPDPDSRDTSNRNKEQKHGRNSPDDTFRMPDIDRELELLKGEMMMIDSDGGDTGGHLDSQPDKGSKEDQLAESDDDENDCVDRLLDDFDGMENHHSIGNCQLTEWEELLLNPFENNILPEEMEDIFVGIPLIGSDTVQGNDPKDDNAKLVMENDHFKMVAEDLMDTMDCDEDALDSENDSESDFDSDDDSNYQETFSDIDDLARESTLLIISSDDEKKSNDVDSDLDSSFDRPSKRRRIMLFDDENLKKANDLPSQASRKNIKPILSDEELNKETRDAEKAERERQKRIEEKQALLKTLTAQPNQLVLDIDKETKEILVQVEPSIVEYLKPHQVEGIKFLFDCTIESVERLEKYNHSSGCILAHSMGLGKTFQIVAFLHSILTNGRIKEKIKRVLIIVPTNVIANWANEFDIWFEKCGLRKEEVPIYSDFYEGKTAKRVALLKQWHDEGGILPITSNLMSSFAVKKRKNSKKKHPAFKKYLLDLGPDMVIIDEGHLLKNDQSDFNRAVSSIKTLRRIILTGTPLQNNLGEYFTMISFVKPNLLGSEKEFKNRFENPIKNGQYHDSMRHDVELMKKRSHVLHELVKHCIHRCDYTVLEGYLPSKLEYVLSLRLTETQKKLYKYYLDNKVDSNSETQLFSNCLILKYVCNHPVLLRAHYKGTPMKIEKNATVDKKSVVGNTAKDWFESFLPEDPFDLNIGVKFILLFNILEQCEINGDKMLVFSTSLDTLDLIERFLREQIKEFSTKKDDANMSYDGCEAKTAKVSHRWIPNSDYFRIDGHVGSQHRLKMINKFNDSANLRARLMLLSTKAGGVGINLVGANRCIIFDTSWNPVDDIQAIYRIFRFGQVKPVYVYRFIADGTIEKKIYDRQIIKQSMSHRVLDDQQIERHFTAEEILELYTFNEGEEMGESRQIAADGPKDSLLAKILENDESKGLIIKYHEHGSLLENRPEEGLTEEQQKTAWEEYETEKQRSITLALATAAAAAAEHANQTTSASSTTANN